MPGIYNIDGIYVPGSYPRYQVYIMYSVVVWVHGSERRTLHVPGTPGIMYVPHI